MTASRTATFSAAAVPVAFVLANAVSYALLLAAAHIMDSADYGKLSSLLSLLLISTIPMLALQTVTARRAATETGTAGIVRGTALVGSLAAAVLVVLSPALAAFLHLSSIAGILLVAATVPANAVLGTAMGVAQGRRHFVPLALLMLASTGGRSVGGLIGLLVGRSPNTTLVGVLVGTGAGAVLVAAVGHGFAGHRDSLRDRSKVGVLNETLHAGHALGTFLLLTSLDVLLARHVLSDTDAGIYAVGSVVTRAAVWLPQSVITLMFASLSESHRHRETARRAGFAVVALGVCVVVGTAVLGPIVVSVIGGSKYHGLDDTVWLYALLGSLLSIVQLAVLAGLAQRRARRVALLWLTIALDVTAVLIAGSGATPTRLVLTLVIVTSGAALAALALTVSGPRPAERQLLAPDGHSPEV
jgi:O-antigen/teichoic acid export membrane protein